MKNLNIKDMKNEKISTESSHDTLADVSTRLFGVYDRNGNISTVHKTKNKATIVKNRLIDYIGDDSYFVDFVIVH